MARFLPASMALLLIAAMVLVAPAASSGWVPNPSCSPYPKYETLGEFAVNRYNEQNHGSLMLWAVKDCWVLDRGTGHYTFRFITIVHGGRKYRTEVLEDLSAPGHPPVHNFGYFRPI
ncbi:unnamed protein product [Victoria cruziana]